MEQFDLVVVGAGWYGLGAAKQYHVNHPTESIAILDSASSLGGVWAKERLYEGLKTNNLIGTLEFPDFPMDPKEYGVQPGQHIPGEVVNRYQETYAKHFGIFDFLKLNTKVISAEHKPEGGWTLVVRKSLDADGVEGVSGIISASKLIIASGRASEPFLPRIEGQDTYGGDLFHAKYFSKHLAAVKSEQRVTILGGSKFAWDAAYAYAEKGVKVDWVIRATGHGPCWMAPAYVTPLKKWLEKLVNIRMLHWFSPCVWGEDSGYLGIKTFWHGNPVGRGITNTFWKILSGDVIDLMGYDKHPETKKLKPTTDAFLSGTSFSILNYDKDFFEFIRNGSVKVHIADISHLSPGKVHLADADKTVLDSDSLMCVTGWKYAPPLRFLPEGIESKIGLPVDPETDLLHQGLASQQDLVNRVDAEIQKRFPRLTKPVKFNPNYIPITETKGFSLAPGDKDAPTQPHTAMMLYRFIVPAHAEFLRTKDLAFAGLMSNFSNIITAHAQGLWISAYFDGKLARDPSGAVLASSERGYGKEERADDGMSLDKIQFETVLHNRFGKWRYPKDSGAKIPDFVFEAVPYLDMMMADLGLKVHRKEGWFSEFSNPYGPEDYKSINNEWEEKFGAIKT